MDPARRVVSHIGCCRLGHARRLRGGRVKGMRIAQLAPLAESVPPKLYGGTERVVAWLVDELVDLGHEVFWFQEGRQKNRRVRGSGDPGQVAQRRDELGAAIRFRDENAARRQILVRSSYMTGRRDYLDRRPTVPDEPGEL